MAFRSESPYAFFVAHVASLHSKRLIRSPTLGLVPMGRFVRCPDAALCRHCSRRCKTRRTGESGFPVDSRATISEYHRCFVVSCSVGTYRYTALRYTGSPAWQGALGMVGGTGDKVKVVVWLHITFTTSPVSHHRSALCYQSSQMSVRNLGGSSTTKAS